MHSTDDEVPESLRDHMERLRELPEVREAWRHDLLAAVARPDPASGRIVRMMGRRWSMNVGTGIAAAFVCAALGGLATRLVQHRESPSLASSPVSALVPATQAAQSDHALLHLELVAPTATSVSIVGDFNQWNPTSLPMRRAADGRTWEIEVRLEPGRHTYGFVVDGQLRQDPRAARSAGDDFGIPNSVLMVQRPVGAT
ncbi:MAG: isoamylase early set domain-containing protein [bacterium]